MSMSCRLRKLVLAVLAAGALVAAPSGARADGDLQARLGRGETLTYPQTIGNGDHHYVGGVTYSIVDASPSEMRALFEDVRAYKELLPHTKSARLVGANGPDLFIELRQGNAIVETSYTLRIRREPDGQTVRFWLDTSKPHGIADAWGFFRIKELPDAAPG